MFIKKACNRDGLQISLLILTKSSRIDQFQICQRNLETINYPSFAGLNKLKVNGETSEVSEAVARRYSVKKVFLEISQNSQEDSVPESPFLIKLQTEACNFIKKEALAQVFSCEFSEISKSIFSHRTPPVAASAYN